jgi:hypothetical protein
MLVPSGVVPDTTVIRLQTAAGTPSFDSEGQVQGRLEVFHGGLWGTVCNDDFEEADAQVACRQLGNELGYTLASWSVVSNHDTDDGSGRTWLDDLGCSGSETSLGDCSHPGWGTEDCDHNEDVGVSCTFLVPGDECEECVAGKFSDTTGVAACTSCAAGSYSTVVGSASASDCQLCEAGKASAAPAATVCTMCPSGTYWYANAAIGTVECVGCAAGSYSTVVGSVSPADCQQVRVEGRRSGREDNASLTSCLVAVPAQPGHQRHRGQLRVHVQGRLRNCLRRCTRLQVRSRLHV